jgi:hypothetical protein
MSIERARKALKGEFSDRIPLFDMPTHPGFLWYLTNLNPFTDTVKAVTQAIRMLDVDMLMCRVPTCSANVTATDERFLSLALTEWRNDNTTIRDIYSYDPAQMRHDAAAWSEEKCVREFQKGLDQDKALTGNTGLPIGFTFTSCIHYAAEDLNWPDFLMACVSEEEKVTELLDKFQAASEKILRAWSKTNAEVVLCHDDIANSRSTNLSPVWMRRNLFPRYKAIFEPLRNKGIPIIHMTDGNFIDVVKDLLDVGVDGFFLDTPCMDLRELTGIAGKNLIYFTGPTPATMTAGSPADVSREMDELAQIARDLPRFFFHLPGGWMHNMPLENVLAFYDACKKYGKR